MTTDNISKLADEYANLKLKIDALETEMRNKRKEILSTGRDVIMGEDFKVLVDLRERRTIPYEKAEKAVSAEILAKITNTTQYEVLTLKPLPH